jgi:peptide/nickel transport system permease protein
MLKRIARRALQGVAIVWLVATFTFVLVALAPGDVVDAMYSSPNVPAEVRALRKSELCLDRGIVPRYGCWLRSLATGELGYSSMRGRSVSSALAAAIPNTLLFMGVALTAMFVVGIATGLVQAWRPNSPVDRIVGAISMLCYAMPDFWLGLILLFVFSTTLGWFPTVGIQDPVLYAYGNASVWGHLVDRLAHLTLPVTTFVLVSFAGIARFERAALLDVLSQDYIRTARAKGASERRVLLHHALRNALLPIVTLVGLNLPALLGGAVLIETVFSWPGMGWLTTQAVAQRDYPLVIACVTAASALVVLGTLLADLLYAVVDPRVRSA